MANERYFSILDRLIAKSRNRELDWKEGVFPQSFQVSFPNYSLTLGPQFRGNTKDYVVTILNSEGTAIDEFSDVDLGDGYFAQMDELYQSARRQALGVDKALDEILQELDDDN